MTVALFQLGQVVATPGAIAALDEAGAIASTYLTLHSLGDWGDVAAHDREWNDDAVARGRRRILSVYTLASGVKLWVVTEADRSTTTLLLPGEY